MDLKSFFKDQGIDVYSEVGLDSLSDAERSSVVQFFPAARSVIVFGKEVPVPVYRLPPKEKTRGMLRIAEELDNTAVKLAARFNEEKVPAKPIPLYLPVRIAEGKVQGVVRLKQVAAAGGLGSLGMNTVLLHPRFGPRLLLSGVVTGRGARNSWDTKRSSKRTETPECTGCKRCVSVCPEGAIGPEGVDAFRCRTVSAWVPPVLAPAVKWILERTLFQKCMAPLAPWIARTATIRCSLCVTECPNYTGDERKG